ncbi:MAG: hypothetical protein E6G90_11990, partial [Alphaproteobacteria bacterium]
GDKIAPLVLVGALREAMPPDAVYVEETITHAGILQQHLPWSQPQSFFRAGGGLGQGLGTALGVKLGAPKRPVAALLGDGSFLYNPVTQALGASKGNGLPILIVRARSRHVARRGDRRARLRRARQTLWLPRPQGRAPGRAPGCHPHRDAPSRGRQDRDPQRRAEPINNE